MPEMEEMKLVLKSLPYRICSASQRVRLKILDDLQPIVCSDELIEPAVRLICRALVSTLPRYQDTVSRLSAQRTVSTLLSRHSELTVKHMTAELNSLVSACHPDSTPKAMRSLWVESFCWSCLVLDCRTSQQLKSSCDSLIELQSLLLAAVVASQHERSVQTVSRRFWQSLDRGVDLKIYIDYLSRPESTLINLSLTSLILQYSSLSENDKLLADIQSKAVSALVRLTLSGRVSVCESQLQFCSRSILSRVDHTVWAESVVPALCRGLLRSPDLVLPSIVHLMAEVPLDLSRYVQQLAPPLISQLACKQDTVRSTAGRALSQLGEHCSDTEAVLTLVDLLLAYLDGRQSKLSTAEQKQSVLTVVGSLSSCAITGASMQQMAATVCQQLSAVLAAEQHEATHLVGLQQLQLWCARLGQQLPVDLIHWFQALLTRKNNSPQLRLGCMICMEAVMKGSAAQSISDVAPVLHDILARVAKNLTQIPVLSEGVLACILLLRLSNFTETHIDSVFKSTINKHYLFSDKFSTGVASDVVPSVSRLCEVLLMSYRQRLGPSTLSAVVRCLAVLLARADSHRASSGKLVVAGVRKILLAESSIDLAVCFVEQLTQFMNGVSVKTSGESREGSDSLLSSHSVHLALQCIVGSVCSDCTNRNSLALALLAVCHHQSLLVDYFGLWEKLVRRLGIAPEEFVHETSSQLLETFCDQQVLSKTNQAVLSTLSRVAGDVIVKPVIDRATCLLNNDAILAITFEEYSIFITPEGVLYKQSVKDSLSSSCTTNVKRESKLYSYQQQLELLEEQRQLHRKLLAEGREHEVLTPKQREAVNKQLAKESAVRARLAEIQLHLDRGVSLILAIADGNSTCLQHHYTLLFSFLLPSLTSPLASSRTVDLFRRLAVNALAKSLPPSLAECVVVSSLCLLAPYFETPTGWNADVSSAEYRQRLIVKLHELCTSRGTQLSAPAFSTVFYLVKSVLDGGCSHTPAMEAALKFTGCHANLRGDGDLNDPSLLPLHDMFVLMLRVIGSNEDHVRRLAVTVLLQLATTCTGEEDCAIASSQHVTTLYDALYSPTPAVKLASLKCLSILADVISGLDDPPLIDTMTSRILLARFDADSTVKEEADGVWSALSLQEGSSNVTQLLDDCIHSQPSVQQAAGEAIGSLLNSGLAEPDDVIDRLLGLYADNFKMSEPVLDEFERVLVEPIDLWHARAGVGQALKTVGPLCPQTLIIRLMKFFVSEGLNDRAAEVRSIMLTASLACIDTHGKENVSDLLPLFDEFLESTPNTEEFDSVRQSVVILMGSLAKHMDKTDTKIKPIFTKLLQMLSTPSEQVQESASTCLPALVAAVKTDVPDITRSLLSTLLGSEKFSERRGAAYGIAGLVKGSGILSLKQLEIMSTLIDAIQDKKDFKKREGALFAFTMLCNKLGRLFEPYIVHILPHLLLCYGDQNSFVRDATHETARAVMSNLSTHGVKLVLPALLAALQEDSWRTKAGSVDLLGSMAYCAPKQLSSCLPNIVPQLIIVLGDSHQRVQKAGAHALKQIGSVIRNPEVQTIVPDLLSALRDPANKTSSALNVLIDTKFIHFIDAPSLALIMPVVQRAFQDRSTEVRKMAAQIIGNMYSLTDQKDLTPYLPAIIPGLKSSLLDPVPEVRSKSARALGAMVRGMGEASFDSLMPWLMQTLVSDQNSVDRSGAAQGLSEVVGGLGVDKLHNIMPDIISTASRTDIVPHVRDGYIMLFIYMPMVFPEEFTRYIGDIIPPILKALADETEYVRDTALRAGQRVVNTYADSAVQLLLPELEAGLFDENWRIRLSSIQLLGDLLYRISGVSGKMTTETAGDDDNFGTEKSHQSIVRLLGTERRNRVLSGLYMGRSDVSLMVRQISLHVWKVVVSNTPSTLREILPTLLSLLLGHLASESNDKRLVAAHTLGDLVRKLGERVLVEILPILERGLDSDSSDERRGVCIGLGEIMSSTGRDVVLFYADNLIPTVRRALVDPLAEVRSAAAKTFDSLHSTIGTRALDEILPHLMERLSDSDAEMSACALDGLRQLIAVKSRAVLPHLLPRLVAPPVNTHALSVLAQVAGDALTRHLVRVLPALLSVCGERQEQCLSVLLAVTDTTAVRTIVDTLLADCTDSAHSMEQRLAVTGLLAAYCRDTTADLQQHEVQLMTAFIQMFVIDHQQLLLSAWAGLEAVLKRLQITAENNYISQLRQAFRFAQTDLAPGELLPGMCLAKGITPLLPVFREAVLNGAPELKESASAGLRELVRISSVPALRSSVIHITGPLIRVLGDRFSASVKVAVLQCLALLLEKVGILLRPFLPQLQTTFVKALSDAHRQVRLHAATSLGHLMPIHSRVDPLFTELITMAKSSSDELATRETTLQALRNLCRCGGVSKLSEPVTEQLSSSLLQLISPSAEESSRMAAAGCLGQLLSCTLPDQLLHSLLNTLLHESKSGDDWSGKHCRTAALYVGLMCGADKLLTDQWHSKIEQTITSCLKSDRAPLVANGARATAFVISHQLNNGTALSRDLLQLMITAFTTSSSNDVKQVIAEAIEVIARCGRGDKSLPRPVTLALLPVLMSGIREKNAGLRSSSESALIALLCLSTGNEYVQKLLEDVNVSLRDTVEDFVAKVSRKIDTFSGNTAPSLDETEVC